MKLLLLFKVWSSLFQHVLIGVYRRTSVLLVSASPIIIISFSSPVSSGDAWLGRSDAVQSCSCSNPADTAKCGMRKGLPSLQYVSLFHRSSSAYWIWTSNALMLLLYTRREILFTVFLNLQALQGTLTLLSTFVAPDGWSDCYWPLSH